MSLALSKVLTKSVVHYLLKAGKQCSMGSSINNVTTLGERVYDSVTKIYSLLLKSVTMCMEGPIIIQNRLTSWMDGHYIIKKLVIYKFPRY